MFCPSPFAILNNIIVKRKQACISNYFHMHDQDSIMTWDYDVGQPNFFGTAGAMLQHDQAGRCCPAR